MNGSKAPTAIDPACRDRRRRDGREVICQKDSRPLLPAAAATRQGVPPDRVSFIDALDVLRLCPFAALKLTLTVNPKRPDRDEPRAIKRRKDRYTYMTRPREELRKALGITRESSLS